MKKILIVIPTLRSGGGVIRGLQNMLSLLPIGKYKIDVLPTGYSDINNTDLPQCTILGWNFGLNAVTAEYNQTKGYKYRILLWLAKCLLSVSTKLGIRENCEKLIYRRTARKYIGYDVVIAYQEGASTRFAQYIKANKRIAWIHCDYREYYNTHHNKSEENIYNRYNDIVCVSKYTLDNFQKIYPALRERSTFIYNFLDYEYIVKSSLESIKDAVINDNLIRLISIGRLHYVKQFHLIPSIITEMIKLGARNFKWVLIGSGDEIELKKIMTAVNKYNVKPYFEYLGPKQNPYPYIRTSDILVSTSLSEACPFVVNEAKVLNIPVVSNNYPSIYEFITDGYNGRIVTIESLPHILTNLINNEKELMCLKERASKNNYDNLSIIEQVCKLIEK